MDTQLRIATSDPVDRLHHLGSLRKHPQLAWRGYLKSPFDEACFKDIDALVVTDEYYLPNRLALAACKRLGIPSFHIVDGIMEWRNLFENPRSIDPKQGTPLFQPLLADYTFAMGSEQAEALRWLGNSSVFATGLPRFDDLDRRNCRIGPSANPEILIASANTPWFSAEQESTFRGVYDHLPGVLDIARDTLSTPFAVRWRVAACLQDSVADLPKSQGTAAEALDSCSALISTPSSLVVEAMILGIPTLVLDPYAVPALTPAAWSANDAATASSMLGDLLAPSPQRASFQDWIRDRVTTSTPSASDSIARFICDASRSGSVPPAWNVNEPSTSSKTAPNIQNQSRALEALALTLPALDAKLAEQEATIQRLEAEIHERRRKRSWGSKMRAKLFRKTKP